MNIFQRKPQRYEALSYFEWQLGRFQAHIMGRLAISAMKKNNVHEYNHLILAMNAGNTSNCSDDCKLAKGYVWPGDKYEVQIRNPKSVPLTDI